MVSICGEINSVDYSRHFIQNQRTLIDYTDSERICLFEFLFQLFYFYYVDCIVQLIYFILVQDFEEGNTSQTTTSAETKRFGDDGRVCHLM